MILSVVNQKGGTSKTTSAAFLAHALHERGRHVLAIDTDPQKSLTRWAEMAGWPFPVRSVLDIAGAPDAPGWDVVIDTAPTVHASRAVEQAVRISTHVVVPIGPTAAEYERSAVVRELLDDCCPPATTRAALLVRTVASASSTAVYRELLEEDGWTVLRPTIGRRERYAQAFGGPIDRALSTGYGDVLAELLPTDVPVEV